MGAATTQPAISTGNSATALMLRPKRNRSRAGCFTCRLRRKKCDEARPKCGTCSKHMLKCIWPRKGQGRLTKEMREKMKREVDLYDESCNFALDGGSQEPDTPQTPYRLRRSGSQPLSLIHI